jgi:enoyl-CoA hydratase/carnithine racemase
MAGTYHLPKLVGYPTSLDMILTGRNIRPDKAVKMGLVDLVVDPVSLESAAILQAQGLISGTVKPKKRKRDWMSFFLESNPIGRNIMFSNAKKTVDKSSGTNYYLLNISIFYNLFIHFLLLQTYCYNRRILSRTL